MTSDPKSLEQKPHRNGNSSYFFLLVEAKATGTAIVGNPIPISQPVADMFVNHSIPSSEHRHESPSFQKTPEIKPLDNENAVREFVRSLLTSPDPAEKPNNPATSQGSSSQGKTSEEKNTCTPSSSPISERLKSFLPFSPSQCAKPEVSKANENDVTLGSVPAEDIEDDDDDMDDSDEETTKDIDAMACPKLENSAGKRSTEPASEG